MVMASFLFFLLSFVLIGVISSTKSSRTTHDYLLASNDVKPWLVGLSGMSSTLSGGTFVGSLGFVYLFGLDGAWMYIMFLLGDMVASIWAAKKLRRVTETQKTFTYSAILSRWFGKKEMRWVRVISALLIIFFLGSYAAAQLKAGSKALHVMFDWDLQAGAVIGALIVLAYCLAGGIRATVWTDSVQAVVMISGLLILSGSMLNHLGGFGNTFAKLNEIDSSLLSLAPKATLAMSASFLIGWFCFGIGILGQPHVMVRFMMLDREEGMNEALVWFMLSKFIVCTLIVFIGLQTRAVMVQATGFDAELAMPMMAKEFLPDLLVGMVLATIFAATISTADSQILSTSSALTRDLIPSIKDNYVWTKVGTVLVTMLALIIALGASENVFSLVLVSYSALAAAFTPLVILYLLGIAPSQFTAVMMMLIGVATAIGWKFMTSYSGFMVEAMPGVAIGFAVYLPEGIYRLGRRIISK